MPAQNRSPVREFRLELVEGCPLRCHSCGVRGIREDGDTSLVLCQERVWRTVFDQIRAYRWTGPRLVLTGRGEPMMHPRIDEILDYGRFRTKWCKLVVETSGRGLVQERYRDPDLLYVSLVNRLAKIGRAHV